MLNAQQIKNLKANWGEKALTLNCFAEVKLIDTLSSWVCYLFAMDQDENMVDCLIYTQLRGVERHTLCMSDIHSMYNENGEHPMIDHEFRRIRVPQLLRRLNP